MEVLDGMRQLLEGSRVKLAVCTYHRAGDKAEIKQYFSRYKSQVEESQGIMLFLNEIPHMQFPFFRTGLLRVVVGVQAR